jgi:hypothetical protein
MYQNEKKIGFLGSTGTIRGASFLSTNELLSKIGQNTGNLFFQYAVYGLITDEKLIIGEDIPWDPKIVREQCRILVVPSANFLRENFDITGYVNFLESCQLPILFLGLGAQAINFEVKNFDFHPSIIKLINIIKNQGIGVGVRGEFSAKILHDFGVDNVSIIGCPTNFVNTDSNLSDKLKLKWDKESQTIITTGDEPWPKNPLKQLAERRLIEIASKMSGIYVQQSVEPFVRILRRANPYQGSEIESSLENSLRLAIAPNVNEIEFRRFLATSVRLYISIDQWLEECSKFDFAIGLRLHGNMVAFQSGCPAIWIYHDARTQELVNTMCLPSISVEKFLEFKNIEDLKINLNYDFDRYKVKRKELKSNFDLLLSNNLVN